MRIMSINNPVGADTDNEAEELLEDFINNKENIKIREITTQNNVQDWE